jgi:hypothetical protein
MKSMKYVLSPIATTSSGFQVCGMTLMVPWRGSTWGVLRRALILISPSLIGQVPINVLETMIPVNEHGRTISCFSMLIVAFFVLLVLKRRKIDVYTTHLCVKMLFLIALFLTIVFDCRYRSAISGPVNTVIMIDASSSEDYDATLRLLRQKEAAILLLNSLNYWSFFNVGVYTDDASFFSGSTSMLRATSNNKESAVAFINTVVLDDSTYVSLENTLKSTQNMLTASESGGKTTYCHSLVVFLATDHNDLASADSISDTLNAYTSEGNLVILSFIFNFQSALVDPIYEEMTCLTNGFQQVMTSSAHDDSSLVVLQKYSAYLAATLENTDIRYSEIYADVLGMGDLTTGNIILYYL